MKKQCLWIGMTIMLSLSGTLMALAAGPGEASGTVDHSAVREYPGWNGAGPSVGTPLSGSCSEDEWENDDDDEDGPWAVSYARGWRYNPNGWWFQNGNGAWPSNGWKYIDARWYRFSETGHIVTGWFKDSDGLSYYLNPIDDGTLGSMRIGWQIIDGKAYYFNPKSDGKLGRMLTDTTTPDGYKVDALGVKVD